MVRRVPDEFVPFDKRGVAAVSTGVRIVDNPRAVVAKERVAALDADLLRYWLNAKSNSVDLWMDVGASLTGRS